MSTPSSLSKNLQLFLPPFILAFVLGTFTLGGGFVLDDIPIVSENMRLDALHNIPSFFTQNYWGDNSKGGLFRPLTLTSFSIENALWGRTVALGYHFTNVILYALCAGLISLTAFRMGASLTGAIGGALLFAAHPIHVEPVAGIVGRSELGACLFLLLALWNITTKKNTTWFTAIITSLSFLAAIFFKETGIALIPTLALLSFCDTSFDDNKESPADTRGTQIQYLQNKIMRHWRMWILISIFSLIWFTLRSNALKHSMDISFLNNPLAERDAIGRIAGALEVFLFYLKMSVIPWPMSVDYSYAALVPTDSLLSLKPLIGVVILVAISFSSLFFVRKNTLISIGLALFLFSIFPTLNILLPIGTIFGERLLYIPTVGLALFIAGIFTIFSKMKKPILLTVVPLALIGSAGFILRTSDWNDELSITQAAYKVQPMSSKINEKLGWELIRLADKVSYIKATLYQQAEKHLNQAIKIYPENGIAHLNLGVLYQRTGRFKESVKEALAFNSINKNHWLYFNLLSSSYFALNEYEKALDVLNKGLLLYPEKKEWRMRREALGYIIQSSNSYKK